MRVFGGGSGEQERGRCGSRCWCMSVGTEPGLCGRGQELGQGKEWVAGSVQFGARRALLDRVASGQAAEGSGVDLRGGIGTGLGLGFMLCSCAHRCWQRSGAWVAGTDPHTSWFWCRCTAGLQHTTLSACCRARTQLLSVWMRGELVTLHSSAPDSSSAGAL